MDELLKELRELKLSIKHIAPQPFSSFPEEYKKRYIELTEAILILRRDNE